MFWDVSVMFFELLKSLEQRKQSNARKGIVCLRF